MERPSIAKALGVARQTAQAACELVMTGFRAGGAIGKKGAIDLCTPLVGVVSAPALGTEWFASSGGGAFRNGKRCDVSQRRELSEALCATGFPYDRWENPDDNVAEFAAFLRSTRGIRRCGSAAIDLAMVADATFDIYWERGLNPWDMCAGALLVLEAGGQLSNYQGEEADPTTGELVATNGHLHKLAISTLGLGR